MIEKCMSPMTVMLLSYRELRVEDAKRILDKVSEVCDIHINSNSPSLALVNTVHGKMTGFGYITESLPMDESRRDYVVRLTKALTAVVIGTEIYFKLC